MSKRYVTSPYWEYVNNREQNCNKDVSDMNLEISEPVTISLQEQEKLDFLETCEKNLGLLHAKQKRIWKYVKKGLTVSEISRRLHMHRTQVRRELVYIRRTMMDRLGGDK